MSSSLKAINPFATIDNLDNSNLNLQPLTREEFQFNSDARILKSVTINYISLDGSEKTMVLNINKSIDWHNTYILAYNKTPEITPILDVSVTKPEQQENISNEKNTSLTLELPLQSIKVEDFFSLSNFSKKIRLNTQDELIGDFIIGNPNKIVLDFQREVNFKTKNINLDDNTPFKRVVIGSHKGYYRVVIYLDGQYDYSFEKDANGYIFYLK